MYFYKITASGLLGVLLQAAIIRSKTECGVFDSNNNQDILPWIANVYRYSRGSEHKFICSGTVVSPKIIITAARCFYDDGNRDIKNNAYVVTVGQKSKPWSSNGGQNFETIQITSSNILTAQQYKGTETKYAYNIAIIKLDTHQTLNTPPKSACIDWDTEFLESELETNVTPLKVISWTNTDHAFKVLTPSYIDSDLCFSLVPKAFREFLTFDKMCGQTEGTHAISSLGGGLFALNAAKNRWYLIGVACETSTSNSKTFMTFTKVQTHLNWISNNAFLEI